MIILCFGKIEKRLGLIVNKHTGFLDEFFSLLGSVGELGVIILLNRFLLGVEADRVLLIVGEGARSDLFILEGIYLDLVLLLHICDLLFVLFADCFDLSLLGQLSCFKLRLQLCDLIVAEFHRRNLGTQ